MLVERMVTPAIHISRLSHSFGNRAALVDLDLTVSRGEVFGLLGPNGGGKTTLFRILTTYYPIQAGQVRVLGFDPAVDPLAVRERIGVVFQYPSLDKKLSVEENLKHHARLYGMSASEGKRRTAEMLGQLGIADRRRERVETLSGGLARRVELAKGLLHEPELLILDEPSTGLDPGARRDLWQYLGSLQDQGVTVLVTTHLMEEAERCHRIGILDRGRLIAEGTPERLRSEIGGEVITLEVHEPERLAERLRVELKLDATVLEGRVRIEHRGGHAVLARVAEFAGPAVESMAMAKPTLEDVFIRRTGHRFWTEAEHG
ncbi:MAG: ATP-binding cassette domain-containing protein [Planctomycetota bacterium]